MELQGYIVEEHPAECVECITLIRDRVYGAVYPVTDPATSGEYSALGDGNYLRAMCATEE